MTISNAKNTVNRARTMAQSLTQADASPRVQQLIAELIKALTELTTAVEILDQNKQDR